MRRRSRGILGRPRTRAASDSSHRREHDRPTARRRPSSCSARVRRRSSAISRRHTRRSARRIDIRRSPAAATVLVDVDLLRDEARLVHPSIYAALFLEGMTSEERVGRAPQSRRGAPGRRSRPPEQAAGHLAQTVPANDPFVSATLRSAAEHSMAQGAPEAAAAYLRRRARRAARRRGTARRAAPARDGPSSTRPLPRIRLSAAIASPKLDDVAERPDVALAHAQSLIMLGNQREAIELIRSTSDAVRTRDPVLHWRLEGLLIIAAQDTDPALYRWPPSGGAVRRAETDGRVTSGLLLAACASEEARAGVSWDAVDYCRARAGERRAEPKTRSSACTRSSRSTLAGKAEEAAEPMRLRSPRRARGEISTT